MNIKDIVAFDIELFPNYFLLSFKHVETGKVISFESKGSCGTIRGKDRDKIIKLLRKRTLVGFNSNNYDIPILAMYLTGSWIETLKKVSDYIIESSKPGWMTMKHFAIEPIDINHIDLMEPSPGVMVGLKLYGARLHSQRLQDLPYPPDKTLTEKEMKAVLAYCENDLDTTINLFHAIQPNLELREKIGAEYRISVMSKSDGQIAEAIFKSKLGQIKKPGEYRGTIQYDPPQYLKFKDPQLKEMLSFVRSHKFELDGRGAIKLPTELKGMKIEIGRSTYRIGIGGLHSSEKAQSIKPNKKQIMVERDVTSYYPMIIINRELSPKHLDKLFLKIYNQMFEDRKKAKQNGDKLIDVSLKLALNSIFGKLGSKYSFLYSPELMLNVTLTGQLCLLWLIEVLERNGISIISANTDGFVSLLDKVDTDTFDSICQKWEKKTEFNLEDTTYKALYSRDVNNYLAITTEDKTKGKGIFTETSLRKNPAGDVIIRSVKDYLLQGTPIEDTINKCKDPREFILARTVKGGAVWKEQYLGRVVRWVHSTKGEAIRYESNGNRVPKSDAAWPMMEMGGLPKHIDYNRYINEAHDVLKSLGIEENSNGYE